MRVREIGFAVVVALSIALGASPAFAAGVFSDWAAVVVAGDWHAHDGSPSEAFDNARRDISSDLVRLGFAPGNVLQFSVRPDNYPERPAASDSHTIATSLWDLSNRTSAGCLVYFTSHGSPDGIVMGNDTYAPDSMSQMLDNSCSDRPTVVIVSACFSGVFVPVLQAPNRMILTAARPDRTSFGCGSSNHYTFFDQCVLETLPASSNFPDFGRGVQACVAAREKSEKVAPPSEPQLFVGATALTSLPRWR
jgi:Peptidase C13 family